VVQHTLSLHEASGSITSTKKEKQEKKHSWVWWHIPIPALGRLRQEDQKFKTSLSVRPYLKNKQAKKVLGNLAHW
jgi:hypothetical protein